MTAAAWVQAIATVALIFVTGWYVVHTWTIANQTKAAATAARDSADAAKESARASRDLVALEQEKVALVEKERAKDRRHFAAELAAELRSLVLRWRQIVPKEAPPLAIITAWSGEESYFSVFDNAGPRMSLLPLDLAAEVIRAYVQAKGTMDNLRGAAKLGEQVLEGRIQAHQGWNAVKVATDSAVSAFTASVEHGNRLAQEVEADLLPKLDAVAAGD
jgi:hypothetical protein